MSDSLLFYGQVPRPPEFLSFVSVGSVRFGSFVHFGLLVLRSFAFPFPFSLFSVPYFLCPFLFHCSFLLPSLPSFRPFFLFPPSFPSLLPLFIPSFLPSSHPSSLPFFHPSSLPIEIINNTVLFPSSFASFFLSFLLQHSGH